MLRNIKHLIGFNILAEDGEIGKVDDIYFSDDVWTVRYCVVNTGPWIFGRKVLVAVPALGQPDYESNKFPVSLTREQVKASPDIDTDKPVSRQQEIELHQHYRWNGYWTVQPGVTGELKLPGPQFTPGPAPVDTVRPEQGDPHLRSTKAVLGYRVIANDGEVGEIDDFLVDIDTWFIHYVVVSTGDILSRKMVLIAPPWFEAIRDEEREFFINVKQEVITSSPEYDPTTPIAQEYEDLLAGHYDRSKFWRQSS